MLNQNELVLSLAGAFGMRSHDVPWHGPACTSITVKLCSTICGQDDDDFAEPCPLVLTIQTIYLCRAEANAAQLWKENQQLKLAKAAQACGQGQVHAQRQKPGTAGMHHTKPLSVVTKGSNGANRSESLKTTSVQIVLCTSTVFVIAQNMVLDVK